MVSGGLDAKNKWIKEVSIVLIACECVELYVISSCRLARILILGLHIETSPVECQDTMQGIHNLQF